MTARCWSRSRRRFSGRPQHARVDRGGTGHLPGPAAGHTHVVGVPPDRSTRYQLSTALAPCRLDDRKPSVQQRIAGPGRTASTRSTTCRSRRQRLPDYWFLPARVSCLGLRRNSSPACPGCPPTSPVGTSLPFISRRNASRSNGSPATASWSRRNWSMVKVSPSSRSGSGSRRSETGCASPPRRRSSDGRRSGALAGPPEPVGSRRRIREASRSGGTTAQCATDSTQPRSSRSRASNTCSWCGSTPSTPALSRSERRTASARRSPSHRKVPGRRPPRRGLPLDLKDQKPLIGVRCQERGIHRDRRSRIVRRASALWSHGTFCRS